MKNQMKIQTTRKKHQKIQTTTVMSKGLLPGDHHVVDPN